MPSSGPAGAGEFGALGQTACLQIAQPLGQDVRGDPPERGLQVGVALGAEQQLTDHQQGPPIAHQVEGPGDAAGVVVGAFRHDKIVQSK